MKPSLVLMFLGGAIILASVISAGMSYERDKERVAAFYQKNGNGAVVPNPLMPEAVRPLDVLGFIAGGIMVAVGTAKSRTPAAAV
jgi:hypothetical protein